jgi:hypothetical protein
MFFMTSCHYDAKLFVLYAECTAVVIYQICTDISSLIRLLPCSIHVDELNIFLNSLLLMQNGASEFLATPMLRGGIEKD